MAKNILADKILIIDFGSQYTQLIARRVRELGVYCEIYNHREIRKNIPIKWNSYTDTETLIESIQYFGLEQTLKKIEGMFAFALYDKKKDQLFLVRDPLGQKPLYYGCINNKFFFASELKAFKAIQGLDLKINRNSLSSFIVAPV